MTYDLILRGGRVIDPSQKLDASADIAFAGGKVALTVHLLSPARRPVQVTRDLASFWATGYKSVKAELKGRYPRHYWPDDPLIAEPTARVRHPRPRP